jgi:hypothetical protein
MVYHNSLVNPGLTLAVVLIKEAALPTGIPS